MKNDSYFTLNSFNFGYVINRILNSCKFKTEFIALVEYNNIMLAIGSHNIILFNSCNKFSIELTLIQYPLFMRASGEHNIILFNECNKFSNELTRI
jgi:hypothetical protein